MKIQIINPNTSSDMTNKIRLAAEQAAGKETQVVATNPEMGPRSVEGFYDGAVSVVGLLHELGKGITGDAVVIACFDDYGLDAARTLCNVPVIGIGEAAFHIASLISWRFGVVTTLSQSVPAIENNILRYGLDRRCSGVRASEVPVLELEDGSCAAYGRISDEIERAIREDAAEAIVLGCAGMADIARRLEQDHGIPIVEGVAAATRLAECLVALGLKTSKKRGYAAPNPKEFVGALSGMAIAAPRVTGENAVTAT